MTRLLLLLTSTALLSAQIPTASPAPCFSGPVAQGTVTLSCTLVDTFSYPGDGFPVPPNIYFFQARVASSDPDVIAVRMEITVNQAANPVITRSVVMLKGAGSFGYSFALNAGYDNTNPSVPTAVPPVVTSITVQELKVASSQAFGAPTAAATIAARAAK